MADKQQPLVVTYRRIEELKPDPANPRRHSTRQIRQIADTIGAFGFNAPIAVDRNDKVVSGPGRLLACRQLGWTEVPTLSITSRRRRPTPSCSPTIAWPSSPTGMTGC